MLAENYAFWHIKHLSLSSLCSKPLILHWYFADGRFSAKQFHICLKVFPSPRKFCLKYFSLACEKNLPDPPPPTKKEYLLHTRFHHREFSHMLIPPWNIIPWIISSPLTEKSRREFQPRWKLSPDDSSIMSPYIYIMESLKRK